MISSHDQVLPHCLSPQIAAAAAATVGHVGHTQCCTFSLAVQLVRAIFHPAALGVLACSDMIDNHIEAVLVKVGSGWARRKSHLAFTDGILLSQVVVGCGCLSMLRVPFFCTCDDPCQHTHAPTPSLYACRGLDILLGGARMQAFHPPPCPSLGLCLPLAPLPYDLPVSVTPGCCHWA